MRTAQKSPEGSHINNYFKILEKHGLTDKGVLFMDQSDQLDYNLNYMAQKILNENEFDFFIEQLIFLNENESGKNTYQQALSLSGFISDTNSNNEKKRNEQEKFEL